MLIWIRLSILMTIHIRHLPKLVHVKIPVLIQIRHTEYPLRYCSSGRNHRVLIHPFQQISVYNIGMIFIFFFLIKKTYSEHLLHSAFPPFSQCCGSVMIFSAPDPTLKVVSSPDPDPAWFLLSVHQSPPRESCTANLHFIPEITTTYKVLEYKQRI